MEGSHLLIVVIFDLLNVAGSVLVRKSVDNLSADDILSLQRSLGEVSQDVSEKGYAAIAAYHGYPPRCEWRGKKVACCVHGSPVFPHWHRLYTVQMEQALKEKGLTIGIPYWDWTKPLHDLPEVARDSLFMDYSAGGKAKVNAWFQGRVAVDGNLHNTARAVDKRLFQKVAAGELTFLFEQVLNIFEYDDFCQAEVQLEVAHNTIHFLVGGRYQHSLSHLEFTSYDPIFFLHHANVDRIFAIYEALRELRGSKLGPGCQGKCEHCTVQDFERPLEPFLRDTNPFPITRVNSAPSSASNMSIFGYSYDNLTLNGYDLDGIQQLVNERTSKDRAFAAFRLYGIGTSVDIRVKVCKPLTRTHKTETQTRCKHAGHFFILGGPLEMPWVFSLPYYLDITKTVLELGLKLTDDYHVEAKLYNVNGTALPSYMLPAPSVHFRPAKRKPSSARDVQVFSHKYAQHDKVSVRKDVDRLSREEMFELREALEKLQNDGSIDGYQALAELHGDPGKCPSPSAKNRKACCIHGKPTFPHWHRLFVVQFEDALRRRGANIGVPYWDWTKPNTRIPALAVNQSYADPYTNVQRKNPFYDAEIVFLNKKVHTTRDVSPNLAESPIFGDHTELFDLFLLALEQDDFCDFEVQFEVSHNLVHYLVGGNTSHGLSSLSYSGFDPIFYLHHSNIDRIWAIWTALQQYRGKPYKAHCAQSFVYQPLKPFSFQPPFNNNKKTFSHSTPTNIDDYQEELGYSYDSLEFGGMSIAELDRYINFNLKGKDRTFAGIQLWGIQTSVLADIYVNAPGGHKYKAGSFALLGGPSEMPWGFDRLYRYDITDALKAIGVKWSQAFNVTLQMRTYTGALIDESQFPSPKIIHKQKEEASEHTKEDSHIRKNVDLLSEVEVLRLRQALAQLQDGESSGDFQDLGRYHGTPKWCPSPDADVKKSCCVHGMPTFPHWHRLWTVQAENSLRHHGYYGALPYWDWTKTLTQLPDLVNSATYVDPRDKKERKNPFYSGHIDDVSKDTVRAVRAEELFQQPNFGHYTHIAQQVLIALEQDNFCDFEVQFEMAHNFIHVLVGGSETFSMSSMMYTAFDPLFYLHHSNTDRIWAIWQSLQKYRGKPYNSTNCAISQLHKPLLPFGLTSDVNSNSVTREHSIPLKVFDYQSNFHYEYDSLEFNGLSISQLARLIEDTKAKDRVFAGFMLHGIGQSATVKFYICLKTGKCDNLAGQFYLLGDVNEMDWAYDRLYLYDITHQLDELHLGNNDIYNITYQVLALNGSIISTDVFPAPTVLRKPGTRHLNRQKYLDPVSSAPNVRRDMDTLSDGELESLCVAFRSMVKDQTYEKIAFFHGKPGLCEHQGRKVGCSVHGKPTFLAWHRLFVKQVENVLLSRGSNLAVPYRDWTKLVTRIPVLTDRVTFFNSHEQRFEPNPFFSGSVPGEDAVTVRDPQPDLFNNQDFYERALLAMEQDNFCDFEIQFEILHNRIHSLLGGRAKYSMSNLDYAAFDPVFFLHHATLDRLWAIWQELQRYRGLPYNEADCAINLMRKPLEPFHDKSLNSHEDTYRCSRPADVFDYKNNLNYEYDTLQFHNLNTPQLEQLLKKRKMQDRVFAGFLLHNIGQTANVDIYICVSTNIQGEKNCNHKAGTFSIFGGEAEMPFVFDRLYKHDITRTIKDLGLRLNSAANFDVKVEIRAVDGTPLDPSILPCPTVVFVPGTNQTRDELQNERPYLVRKKLNSLNSREISSLLQALRKLHADKSANGYQSIAAFHALPPLCPSPEASRRHACCIHGMATFPHWHRLYTAQMEDALWRHGSLIGLPYLSWTQEMDKLPELLTDPTFTDPYTGLVYDNPFNKSTIDFENAAVERDVQDEYLFDKGPDGWYTWTTKQVLFALEQEDFCDFEIQFEIAHNAIHSWLGGSKERSMGHLHYAAYDPAFFLYHSNTDRIWAVWQALQEQRGHPSNVVNCALELMKEPLKPFSFGPPYNLNPTTTELSRGEDMLDYQDHFHYRYDNLELGGLNIPALDAFIKDKQGHDRVFAGFLLKGLGTSALVNFDICIKDSCFEAGYFTLLGGSAEMPWHFDRLYKYEITDQLNNHSLHFDDQYDFQLHVTLPNKTKLFPCPIPTPSVLFLRATKHGHSVLTFAPNRVRKDLHSLIERDIVSLRAALQGLQQDQSIDGWANLTSFHGAPARCPHPDHTTVACCQHGMPAFPHWHRLFTIQVEQALEKHGSLIALPYWDWTREVTQLPTLFTQQAVYDVWKDKVSTNPFAHGYVPSQGAYTVRDVQLELSLKSHDGNHSKLFDLVIFALEQEDYCDFEVQFEVIHNAIHILIGGYQTTYSLSSLEYSAYDPFFLIHHSFTDKIWVVWQELQRRRHLPYNRADCAVNHMTRPMKPFSFKDINPNEFTRAHAVPNSVFNHKDLGYTYDNLNIGDYTIQQLEELISYRQRQNRIFIGLLLKGVKTSYTVFLRIFLKNKDYQFTEQVHLLGGPTEQPWAFNRLFKLDITSSLTERGLKPEDLFDVQAQLNLETTVYNVQGDILKSKDVMPPPTIIFSPAHVGT